MTSQEPWTAAGRALLENPQDYPLGTGDSESPFLRAILAIEAEAAAPDPAALADRLVEEGRVSVWGRPGTKFTAKRAKAPETTDG